MADNTQKLTQLKYIQRVTGKDSKGKMTLEPMIVGANAYIYTNKNILLTDAKTPTKGFGANSIYLGTGIKGTEANQLIIGQYNNSTTDIFTIGGGSSATQTKDIFTVSSNGTITQVGDYSGTIGQFRLWGKQKTAGERPMMSIYDGLDGNEDRYKSVGFVDLNEFTTISNGIHLVTQYTEEGKIYQGRGIVQVVGVLQLGTQEDDPKNKGQSIYVPRLRGANGTVHIGTSDDRDKTTIHGSLEVTGTSDIAGITVGKDLTVAGTFTLGDSENGQESSWGGDIKFYTSRGHCETINLNQLKKSVSDGKSLLASTITTLGVETKEDATFNTLNTNLKKIFTTESAVGNAETSHVLAGKTFTSSKGKYLTGTMTNHGNPEIGSQKQSANTAITNVAYNVDTGRFDSNLNGAGYYTGANFYVPNCTPENIKYGVKVGGVNAYMTGTFSGDATATKDYIVTGYSAYVKGDLIEGDLVRKGSRASVAQSKRRVSGSNGNYDLYLGTVKGAYIDSVAGQTYPEVYMRGSELGTAIADSVLKGYTFTSGKTSSLATSGTFPILGDLYTESGTLSYLYVSSAEQYICQQVSKGAHITANDSIKIPASKFGTAQASQVLKGSTFTSSAGLKISGTVENITIYRLVGNRSLYTLKTLYGNFYINNNNNNANPTIYSLNDFAYSDKLSMSYDDIQDTVTLSAFNAGSDYSEYYTYIFTHRNPIDCIPNTAGGATVTVHFKVNKGPYNKPYNTNAYVAFGIVPRSMGNVYKSECGSGESGYNYGLSIIHNPGFVSNYDEPMAFITSNDTTVYSYSFTLSTDSSLINYATGYQLAVLLRDSIEIELLGYSVYTRT